MEKTPSSKIIFTFLFLGFFAGLIVNIEDNFLGINLYNIFDLVGQIFLNSLKMIVVPLIMSSLIHNISSFTSTNDLSNLGIKTIAFYLVTSFSAIIIGITVVNIIEPGLINGVGAANIVGLSANYNINDIIIL